jgi:hypothetical protein
MTPLASLRAPPSATGRVGAIIKRGEGGTTVRVPRDGEIAIGEAVVGQSR